ncbi:hypothetical protein [Chitinophaga qingshengii]|uniref:Protein BatD n=1 Tax=Chitinophaga qingshengii TaxID=1569794 RepID=A0ABR7TMW4_9BACT|nr:hypothetical protein [Chitinophaga qingshengii]MBC9931335.1 hypothetical protein [Chitinophaga qingshengii]
MYKQQVIRRILLSFFIGLLFPFGLLAQQTLEVTAKADTSNIRIGEQVKLHLRATVPAAVFNKPEFRLLFPTVPDSLEHFEVVNRSNLDTLTQQDLKVLQQTLTVTSFDSGRWEFPPLKFEVYGANGANSIDTLFSQPLGIDVNTVAVDTTKAFKPIKTVQAVPWNIWDYWLYIAIGAAVVLIVLGLLLYFRKRPEKKPAVKLPLVTPYELAVQQLKSLKGEQLWQQGDIKQYYTRLTDILRTYFEHQFGIAALEQTSEELLNNIKPVTKLNQQRDKLRALLAIADLAKFAKLQPTADEHEDCMHKAEEILEWTRPKEEPVVPEEKPQKGA